MTKTQPQPGAWVQCERCGFPLQVAPAPGMTWHPWAWKFGPGEKDFRCPNGRDCVLRYKRSRRKGSS